MCVCGNIGFNFIKEFKGFGYYQGVVIEIKRDANNIKDRTVLYTDGNMKDLSLKQLSSLHSRNNHFLLAPNTPPKCDDEKSYLPTFESNDDFVNNDDQSDISSINSNGNNKKNSSFTINNDNIIFVSQKVQSLKSNARSINLDTIQNMLHRNLYVYCIQETCLDGNFI